MLINGQRLLTAQAKEPPFLSPWLHHELSLTDKLVSPDLTVLSQQWLKPSWWDEKVLRIKDSQVLQREIIMKSRGVAYWYAKTIIPQSCYQLNPDFFKRLERESIRNLIFDTKEVHRVKLESYSIDSHCIEWHWVQKYLPDCPEIVWVRFSEHSFLHTKTFYLLELLLPELERVSA